MSVLVASSSWACLSFRSTVGAVFDAGGAGLAQSVAGKVCQSERVQVSVWSFPPGRAKARDSWSPVTHTGPSWEFREFVSPYKKQVKCSVVFISLCFCEVFRAADLHYVLIRVSEWFGQHSHTVNGC